MVLDPTWWRRTSDGDYNQKGGMLKRMTGASGGTASWVIYIDGVERGSKRMLRDAKEEARKLMMPRKLSTGCGRRYNGQRADEERKEERNDKRSGMRLSTTSHSTGESHDPPASHAGDPGARQRATDPRVTT